ncbi:MAG: phage holin [Aeriscardovia sp.]|nr:phage holin [Aeriscardovia sp.]
MEHKIAPDTIARTIVLALALINQLLINTGKTPIPIMEDDVYQLMSIIFTIITAIIAWWYNNSFTKHARRADDLLEALKNGGID